MKHQTVGIFGRGRFGRFLHSARGDAVIAICDQAASLRVEHPTRRCRRLEELLDIPDIDVVAVATPPSSHASLAIRAMASGKDVATVDHVLRLNPLVMAATELARANMMGAFRSRVVVDHADRTAETEFTAIDAGFDAGSLRSIGWMPLNGELRADSTTQRRVREAPEQACSEFRVQEGSQMRISLPDSKTDLYRSRFRVRLSAVGTERIDPGSLPVTLEDDRRALGTAQAATNRCLEGQE